MGFKISSIKVCKQLLSQLIFDRYLEFYKIFDQRYLGTHLTKFEQLFFFSFYSILQLKKKKLIEFAQVGAKISLIKVCKQLLPQLIFDRCLEFYNTLIEDILGST